MVEIFKKCITLFSIFIISETSGFSFLNINHHQNFLNQFVKIAVDVCGQKSLPENNVNFIFTSKNQNDLYNDVLGKVFKYGTV